MDEVDFNKEIQDWKEHCKNNSHFSMIKPYLDCDAYRNIVSLGYNALPLIREVYDRDACNDFPLRIVKTHLISAVAEIVRDDFSIPKNLRGRVHEIETYTKKWLDDNMHKYV